MSLNIDLLVEKSSKIKPKFVQTFNFLSKYYWTLTIGRKENENQMLTEKSPNIEFW